MLPFPVFQMQCGRRLSRDARSISLRGVADNTLALQRECDVPTTILMFKNTLCSICLMTVLNVTLATVLEAQAVKVREFQFGPKQGRNVLFGRAVTPGNDVL